MARPFMTNALTCSLRVTAREPEVVRVSVRNQQFAVGRPLELDSVSPRISSVEYTLGALAGEVINGLRQFAWRRRVDLEHAEALVTAELEHALTYLEVVGEEGTPRIAHVHLKVFVASADEPGIRLVWTDMLERLPLLGTLRSAIAIDLELIVTP
jgi:hypothetical protein